MATLSKNKEADFKLEIGLPEGKEWTKDKVAKMQELIKQKSAERSTIQKQKNELVAIKYKMEEYVEKSGTEFKQYTIDDFLKAYLSVLNLTFKKFAAHIDTTDGNLKKYVSGDRKFNTDLAMKFSYFFHTTPELWLKVQMKNELYGLHKEKRKLSRYQKYNFENIIK